MAREYCHRCGAERNASVTERRTTATGPDGEERRVLRRSYHCETCGAFLRGEEVEAPQEGGPPG